MPVKGIERVKRNYRVTVAQIDGKRTDVAVRAVLSEGGSVSDTKTPMDTSTLVNSRYAPQLSHQNGKTTGKIGYTARYAAAVHEAPGTLKGQPRQDFGMTSNHSEFGPKQRVAFGGGTGKGNYWDPSGEPQFLTKGFEQIKPDVPAILKAAYKV